MNHATTNSKVPLPAQVMAAFGRLEKVFGSQDALKIASLWAENRNSLGQSVRWNMEMIEKLERVEPGRCSRLYREYGIAHFGRYTPQILFNLGIDRKKPKLLLFYPNFDDAGAYMKNPHIRKGLSDKFDVNVVEAGDSKEEAREKLDAVVRNSGKSHVAVVAGHGNVGVIGPGKDLKIYAPDFAEIGLLDALYEKAPVILYSCFGGVENGIAQQASEIYQGSVFYGSVNGSHLQKITPAKFDGKSCSVCLQWRDASEGRAYLNGVETTGNLPCSPF